LLLPVPADPKIKILRSFSLAAITSFVMFMSANYAINTFFTILTNQIARWNLVRRSYVNSMEADFGACKFYETLLKSCIYVKMMTKRNRNIKTICIMLQRGTTIMANQVKTPIQNYFEKVVYEHLTWEIPPLWFLELSVEG
jgi:hypothetical protein